MRNTSITNINIIVELLDPKLGTSAIFSFDRSFFMLKWHLVILLWIINEDVVNILITYFNTILNTAINACMKFEITLITASQFFCHEFENYPCFSYILHIKMLCSSLHDGLREKSFSVLFFSSLWLEIRPDLSHCEIGL